MAAAKTATKTTRKRPAAAPRPGHGGRNGDSSAFERGDDDRKPGRPVPASKAVLKDFLIRVAELAGPALAGLGLELVQAQCSMDGGRPVLRLFIDRLPGNPDAAVTASEPAPDPASLVTLDDCAAASRAMDAVLEADDRPQPDGYVLEVSSPGLDRPLLKEADFHRFQGRLAKLRLRRDGRSRLYHGRLGLTAQGGLALETAEGPLDFTFDEVVSGRLSLAELVF